MNSNEINQLKAETRESCINYLPKLINATDMIAENIQTGNSEWVDLLTQFIDGLTWVKEAVSGLKNIDPQILISIDIEQLNKHLEECNSALVQRDFVLLSDVIKYELKPLLENYFAQFKEANF